MLVQTPEWSFTGFTFASPQPLLKLSIIFRVEKLRHYAGQADVILDSAKFRGIRSITNDKVTVIIDNLFNESYEV